MWLIQPAEPQIFSPFVSFKEEFCLLCNHTHSQMTKVKFYWVNIQDFFFYVAYKCGMGVEALIEI